MNFPTKDDPSMVLAPSREMLAGVWRALREEPRGRNEWRVAGIFDEITKNGAAYWYQFEDLVYHLDRRAEGWLRPLVDVFGIPIVWMGHHPRRGNSCIKSDALLAADVVAALAKLERLGFETEPAALAAALRPALRRRKYVIGNELAVLWYAAERHKKEPLYLFTSGEARLASYGGAKTEKFTTPRGYRLEAWSDAEGINSLRATKPARRRGKVIT
jgi:hypothetical protein